MTTMTSRLKSGGMFSALDDVPIMTNGKAVWFSLCIREGLCSALHIPIRAMDDAEANAKAGRIVDRMNVRDEDFVELTRANGMTVCSCDRPYRRYQMTQPTSRSTVSC